MRPLADHRICAAISGDRPLLREVALREGDARLVRFCDVLLVDRLCVLEPAEQALSWFAEQPAQALRSGLRVTLQPGNERAISSPADSRGST